MTLETSNPSYYKVVQPLLRAQDGDPSELLTLYPNFDVNIVLGVAPYKSTYLFKACSQYDVVVLRGLVQCGANLQQVDNHGNSILIRTCKKLFGVSGANYTFRKEIAIITWLLHQSKVCEDINCGDIDGWTALHFVAMVQNYAIVHMLLMHGADPTLETHTGFVPEQLINHSISYNKSIILLLKQAELIKNASNDMEEWRPRNHSILARPFRTAMVTLVMIAKAKI